MNNIVNRNNTAVDSKICQERKNTLQDQTTNAQK